MLKKKLHWERSAITGRIIEENRCQAAQILPGTSIADMLLVFLLQEKKYLKKKNNLVITIFKGKNFYLRHSREYFDAQKGFSRSYHTSDDEESVKIAPSSVPLSVLLIPSLKEVSTQSGNFV